MANLAKPKYRLNPTPRISANQLAEYVLASPTRRQSILRNAKFSPTFLVIRYAAAKEAISAYLSNDARPLPVLTNAESKLLQMSKSEISAYAQNDAALSAEAIRAFRVMGFQQKLPYATFTNNTQNLPKLIVSGVEVSIRLDMVARENAKGLIGGAILQTSKAVASKSWREDHSKIVASLIWMIANNHLIALGKVDRRLCVSIDVFGGDVIPAPSNYKRKLNDVDASCSEIAALWDSISPPADFDG